MFKKNNIILFVLVLSVIAYFMFMNNEHFFGNKLRIPKKEIRDAPKQEQEKEQVPVFAPTKYKMLVDGVNKLLNEYNTVGYLNRNQLIEPHRLPNIVYLYKEYIKKLSAQTISPRNNNMETLIYGYVPDEPKIYISYPNTHETKKMNEKSVARVIWNFELIIDGSRESVVKTNVSNMKTTLVNLSNYLSYILAIYQ